MSDLITHWAVFEDCRRLALIDNRIDSFLARIMQDEREFARLGAISRSGGTFIPHVLKTARETFRREGAAGIPKRRLAFAFGGIAHYAADVLMKPLYSKYARTDWDKAHQAMQYGDTAPDSPIREISAYYDTHVFRKVYLAGDEEPFNWFLLAGNDAAPGQALEEFVFALFQRALLASHTLSPDKKDIDGWLDNLFGNVQPLYVNVRTFVRVFVSPEPEKMAEYGVEDVFYDERDPAIRVSRQVQAGETPDAPALYAALDESANAGAYAKAVCRGMLRLREAAAYWRGETENMPDLHQ